MLWRRRARPEGPPDGAAADVRVLSVARDDEPGPPTSEEAWGELRRIVAEAVIWQDKAEELLVDIRHREPLAELAPRGGPLIRRFCALKQRLPESNDPAIRRYTEALGPVFDHHARSPYVADAYDELSSRQVAVVGREPPDRRRSFRGRGNRLSRPAPVRHGERRRMCRGSPE